jgi:hypothetical protein
LAGRLGVSSLLRLVPADELPAQRDEQACGSEAAGVARCDAQLLGDLTKRQAEAAKALYRDEAVQTTVPLGMCVQFVYECKLAIAPRARLG